MRVKALGRGSWGATARSGHVRKIIVGVTSVLVSINLVVGLTLAFNVYDIKQWLHDKYGYQAINRYQSSRILIKRLPPILMDAVLPGFVSADYTAIPEISIDMKFRHYQKLEDKRREAREIGILLKSDDDFVPVSIRAGSKDLTAKVRLKGDSEDHLRGKKLSLRIKMRGDDTFLGMRTFSVHHPRSRGFHLQALFNETLRHLDVIVPYYGLVRLKLNGEDLGIMYLEEHFTKELLESQGRRESVILKFDEDLFWRQLNTQKRNNRLISWADWRLVTYRFRTSRVEGFELGKIAASPRLSQDYQLAVSLLRSFVEGVLPAADVFDAVSMGKYLATAELWGAYHGVVWNNMRFYYNPITAKLEAIGFDDDVNTRIPVGSLIGKEAKQQEFFRALLESPEIKNEYVKTIKRLQRDIAEGSLIKKLEDLQERELAALRKEFYFLGKFDFAELTKRADYLAAYFGEDVLVDIYPEEYPELIQANIIEQDSGYYVELANIVPFSVRVNSISWVRKDEGPSLKFETPDELRLPLDFAPLPVGELPQFIRLPFVPPEDMSDYELVSDVEIIQNQFRAQVVANRYFGAVPQRPTPQASVSEQLAQHGFIRLDQSARSLIVQPGSWPVTGYIVVPEGYRLVVPPGTTLAFEPHGGILSYGPLQFQGTEQAPIVLRGQTFADASDQNGTWQGVVVIDASEPSEWSHTKILDTTGVRRSNWELTGGVTFYQSEASIKDTRFDGHRGEDALNIIRSDFVLSQVQFSNTMSDAFDSDFSNGRVENALFENIGFAGSGDGVDVSGSEVSVVASRFSQIGDKALSVGERSRLTATNVTVEDVGIGGASKDGSHLIIRDSLVRSARIGGFLAYIKKTEYDSARITADNISFESTPVKARAQTGSTIEIDGEAVATEPIDVDMLYLSQSAQK